MSADTVALMKQRGDAAAEAERQRQLAAKLGAIPGMHQQLNDIAGIQKPFLPPRRIRPVGARRRRRP